MAATAASASSYKQRKEDFVSNLSGGSVGEVFLVSAVAPIAVLAWSVLQSRHSYFRPYSPIAFVVDFLLNVSGILLATTLYASQPLLLNGFLAVQTLFVLVLPGSSSRPRRTAKKPRLTPTSAPSPSLSSSPNHAVSLPHKPFITAYRGCMMVVTCLAILAVDFRIFPRRFAKVETWGTSLMDLGVGSFVFSAGVVAARPVLKERAATALAGSSSGGSRTTTMAAHRPPSLARRLLVSLRHALPLFVLGVVRLLSVKGLDYAEHVTEYGVHWNFFFTLGLLPPFVAAAQSLLQVLPVSPAVLALAVSCAYEAVLDVDATGLRAYLLTAPRRDLLSQNREGLASFVGYLAIFLAGQDTGLYVLPASGRNAGQARQAGLWRWLPFPPLLVWAAVWWVLHQAAIARTPFGLGLTESRRLANLPYVLWVLSFNTLQLSMFWGVDVAVFGGSGDEARDADATTSVVLRAFNRNGLPLFLAANLLTGLVNLTVQTLDASPAAAIGILVAYGSVLTGLAVTLEVCGITIKL